MSLPAPLAAESRAVMNAHARTFSAAAAFLAPDARDEVALLYALCRRIDDLADEHGDLAAIDAIARQLESREADDPQVAAFLDIAEARGIPVDALIHLVDGARSDLGRVRIASATELVRYGYQVAGTVGRLVSPLLGVADPEAERFAVDLGVAMQLSNIARDVGEDARRDRVYLPADWLREAGVEPDDVARETSDRAATASVVARVVSLAERYYDSAEFGFRFLPYRARTVTIIAARRYREIGRKAARRGPEALADRTVVGKGSALWLTLGAPLLALGARIGAPVSHDPSLHAPLVGLFEPA